MVFSSATFLFIFLPVVLILHTVIRNTTARNALLILASLLFYSYGEPALVVLLLVSIIMNYAFGRIICAVENKKAVLTVAVILNLAMLIVFKYAGFLVELINYVPFIDLPVPIIRMPIGISFYTFQALSYVIDTYRDEKRQPGKFFDVMLYISLFPQLVAGPIVKYNSVREQIGNRQVSAEEIGDGIIRFIIGLSKKMLIANTMAGAADAMFALGGGQLDTLSAWVGAISYMLQIYFDFSGYSDMAVGMGKMLGFTFPENFNYPYIAVSMRDFWKRWHISLTSWFREYLYFPLGGNRKGQARTVLNRFFVFLCTGIWHGANLTFLFWGLYHGILTTIETVIEMTTGKGTASVRKHADTKAVGTSIPGENGDTMLDADRFSKKLLSICVRILGHIYTILAVMIGFVIFRADSLSQAWLFITTMFSKTESYMGTMSAFSQLTPLYIFTLAVALVAATPVTRLFKGIGDKSSQSTGNQSIDSQLTDGQQMEVRLPVKVITMIFVLVLYGLCILEIAAGSYNPFIYFRF